MHKIKEQKPLPDGAVLVTFEGELPQPDKLPEILRAAGIETNNRHLECDGGIMQLAPKMAGAAPIIVQVRPATVKITPIRGQP